MPIDWKVFHVNRTRIPVEELAKFAGQWVAWSSDGSHIVAGSGESQAALIKGLEREGRDLSDYAFGYIPGPDEGFI